jgi:3'-phosphoadenosine 5'-phosphosulfate sulfotransferase (PAPS reductase)/FAD synthetase
MTVPWYYPKPDVIERLQQPWIASFSGGKDSGSLVMWLEFARRKGWLRVDTPWLIHSDTEVEYVELTEIARDMMAALNASGWTCHIVRPQLREKLYNRILGVGNAPVHPGGTTMRWCTRSTKIDPMERGREGLGDILTLTGLRLGESAVRDNKIKKRMGCAAGGECGLPELSDTTFSPLLHWSLTKVIRWLNGDLEREDEALLSDLLPITRRLLDIYQIRYGEPVLECGWTESQITTSRFGCIGCPAIEAERYPSDRVVKRHGKGSPLNELYDVWYEARMGRNRLYSERPAQLGPGALKMAVRRRLFARVMDIQKRAGVTLITPQDERFIKRCWRKNVYPRGWSAADELTSDAIADARNEPLLQLTINGE